MLTNGIVLLSNKHVGVTTFSHRQSLKTSHYLQILFQDTTFTKMVESSRSIQDRRLKHLLDEKIEIIEVVPDPDSRSLHTLIMSLSEERFQTITQLLSLTLRLRASKVRNILLEKERKQAAVTKARKHHSNNPASKARKTSRQIGGRGKEHTALSVRRMGTMRTDAGSYIQNSQQSRVAVRVGRLIMARTGAGNFILSLHQHGFRNS